MPVPPFRLIALARDVARELHAQAAGFAEEDAATLIDAASGIWRAIATLEAPPRRRKAGEARTQRSVRRALRQA